MWSFVSLHLFHNYLCLIHLQHTEKLAQYVTKGKAVLVEGELNIDNYEKDGERRSFTKVKVDRLEFLAGNSNNENKANANTLDFQEVGNDEDIPF